MMATPKQNQRRYRVYVCICVFVFECERVDALAMHFVLNEYSFKYTHTYIMKFMFDGRDLERNNESHITIP